MSLVRIGIIGFGGMGSFHGRYLAAGDIPGAKLTAVCDINPERLTVAKEICGNDIQVFDNADALFAANVVDAVLIATPHYFHPPLAIQAFENGCHALSEKPAGVYTKQVREVIAASEKTGKIYGVMFNQRTQPFHQKMRDLVQSGELGEIRRNLYVITDWFRSQAYYDSGGWRATWGGEGGGVLVNQCPHNLDLWQWICGMPTRVMSHCAFGKYHNIEVEDDVTTYVEYENGATGVFITTTGEAPGSNRLEVVGDRGKAILEGGKITLWRNRVPTNEFCFTTKAGFDKPECWVCDIPTPGTGEEHRGITKNFVQAILHGTPLLARGAEGVHGVELANAMHFSAWTNSWVDLPFDEDKFYELLQEKIKTSTFKKPEVVGKANNFAGTF